ncbi:hypothetical protein HU200_038132 [Digitaria exilis]|uniref:Uncharacterized protein n=1 Tax=Digitaria exilis TaxID=1010633 RepID=A0A835BJ41_9POAL|nr:hypothetical protein HU200_038132 [Digitaria exilis]
MAIPRGSPCDKGASASTAVAGTSTKNLLQQLPAGAVLAFQALAATFTNQGNCYTSNWWLTVGLVTFLSATCVLFSFTDTVKDGDGRLHKAIALPGRLHIINLSMKEQRPMSADLNKRGLMPVDCVHAFLSLVVFLTIAGNDVGLQNCFFPKATDDTRQLLRNLPLGMAVMTSFLFMIFPTTRKGITFDNSDSSSPPSGDPTDSNASSKVEKAADKALNSSANLLQLLPTGPVLAFQTLASSFTNQGSCYPSNWWLTVGLVTFLGATCIFFAFTDGVEDCNGKVHKGVALPSGLYILSLSNEERKKIPSAELKRRRLKPLDWVHAFFTAVVFLTIAGSDVGLQNCFFPKANDDTKQMLKNLPLGMAVMSSFVFTIFPTTRKGINFDDSNYSVIATTPTTGASPGKSSNSRVVPNGVP